MVASISASTDAEYYLQVDHSLYYLTGETGVGVWHGEGAKALGYHGQITPEQLRAAYGGFSPDGANSLVQRQVGKPRQQAWDMTFSAPKSVSVLWSVLDTHDRHKIEDLVMRAAKRAVDYIDAEALFTRRRKKGVVIQHGKGVYALCPHGTSRAQDPQLHIHALVINLVLRDDGTTGTIRSRDLYLHKMAAGALFRLELAHLLRAELGLAISQDGWKFKIDGVSESLCEAQSKRRKDIQAIAKEEGWTSPRVLAELALTTRGPKGVVSLADCLSHWQKTANEYGFNREVAEAFLAGRDETEAQANPIKLSADQKKSRLRETITKSVASLAAAKAYFPERDLIRVAATEAQALGLSANELIRAVKQGLNQFEYRVAIEGSVYNYYSTKENVSAEKELLERCKGRMDSVQHLVSEALVSKAKAKVEKSLSKKLGAEVRLTHDQDAALRHITQDPGNVKIVQGHAGTGKTEMLRAAHEAWKEAGNRVLGTAITGKAALGLQKATGIQSVTVELLLTILRGNLTARERADLFFWKTSSAAKTIYYEGIRAGKWMHNPWKQAFLEAAQAVKFIATGNEKASRKLPNFELTPQSILVVDEAAMVPTKTLLAIKQECDKVGAKLVLAGDRLQLPAIEAGGPFWSLAERVVGYESLTTIVRQRQDWMREAVELLIRNEPKQALQLYADNGALHLAKTQRGATEKLIADYGRLKAAEFSKALALTATNEEASVINQGIQAKRKAAKQLGMGSLRLPNGERAYKNDRIMITQNDYSLGVRNGLLGTVVGVYHTRGIMGPGSLTIRVDGQVQKGTAQHKAQTVTVDLKKNPDIQLGYAATTHKVQSITVESSFVLLGDSMLSKERAYTQLSRASHETMLYGTEAQYGDSLQVLAQQISKVTAKDLAHDHTILRQREKGQKHSVEADSSQLLTQQISDQISADIATSQHLQRLRQQSHDHSRTI